MANDTDNATPLRRREHVVARDIGGEKVLVPVCGDRGDLETIFRLNPVGSCIWDALAEPHTEEELAAVVEKHFEVDAATALADLRAFVADLRDAKLLATDQSE